MSARASGSSEAHLRAAASARRASGSSRSASGEPSTNETIDPSPK